MSHRCLRSIIVVALACGVLLGPMVWPRPPGSWSAPGTVNAMTSLTAIAFRPRVLVGEAHVSFWDLCDPQGIPEDWRTLLDGIDLGAAPEVGAVKYINQQNLRGYLQHLFKTQGIDADQVQINLPDKIIIERRQMRPTLAQVEALFREFVLARIAAKPEDIVVQLTEVPELPALASGTLTSEVVPGGPEQLLGNVALTIQFSVDGNRAESIRVAGKVSLYQEVVHARRAMKRNDTISADDIQLIRTNIADHPERFLTQPDQVIGKRLLCSVGIDQTIGSHMLDKALTVKRGDIVLIVHQLEGLKLTAKGQAKENGALGDRIRITNVDSNKNIFCKIIDARTVELTP
jgi:flagellar basal body P-ring formation protein FlgA